MQIPKMIQDTQELKQSQNKTQRNGPPAKRHATSTQEPGQMAREACTQGSAERRARAATQAGEGEGAQEGTR